MEVDLISDIELLTGLFQVAGPRPLVNITNGRRCSSESNQLRRTRIKVEPGVAVCINCSWS
jgi:hypothetical protein